MANTKTTKTTKTKTTKTTRNEDKMWSDITGKCRVWGKEVEYGKNKSFMSYSTSIGKKNDDEEYDNVYFNVRFKKDEHPDIEGAFNINIKHGFLTLTVDNDGRCYHTLMVTEYELSEDGESE